MRQRQGFTSAHQPIVAAMTAIALTIAGSDSSGGAGIQADLKTFSALHVYGASVITALTAQNTQGVDEIMVVPPEFVLAQMRSVMSDLAVNAIKIGMLGTAGVIDAVVEGLREFPGVPVVLDPVMVATSGDPLLDEDAVDSLREKLIPLATLITPNLKEAALLLGEPEDRREKWMEGRAERLLRLGARAVLLKGGDSDGETARDIFLDGKIMRELDAPRVRDQEYSWHGLHAVFGNRRRARQGRAARQSGQGRQGLCHRRHHGRGRT